MAPDRGGGPQPVRTTLGLHVFTITLLIILAVALFSPIDRMVTGNSDYSTHIDIAAKMIETGVIEHPHFLYQLLVIIVHALTPGIDISDSGFIVGLSFHVLLGVVIYALIHPTLGNWPMVSVLIALALMVVSPINLLTWSDHNLYFGYVGINVFHNPTSVILKPLALLLFLYAAKVFSREATYAPKTTILISGTLAILSTLAKPSYAIVLLPGLAILCGLQLLQRQPIDWRLLILGIAVPTLIVFGWQYYGFTHSPDFLVSSQPQGDYTSSIIFAPFKVYSHYSSLLFPKFVLSILFPLSVFVLYAKEATKDIGLRLAWLIFLVGAFYIYFLAEDGPRMFCGNFGWSAQVALFILFVVSTIFLLRQQKLTKKFVICTVAFGLHLISGIVWYNSQLGVEGYFTATSWY